MENQNKPVTLATLRGYALEIESALIDSEGEITEDMENALTLINSKLLGGCFAIDNRRNAVADKKAMIKELQASIKRDQKSLEFLEGAVMGAMDALGVQKLESYKKFSLAKKPGRVEVVEPEKIPNNYSTLSASFKLVISDIETYRLVGVILRQLEEAGVSVTTNLTPNKTAIKEAIKRGEVVPGAQLIENEKSFRIK